MSADVAGILARIGTDPAAGREALSIVAAFLREQGHPLAHYMTSAVGEAEKTATRDRNAAYVPTLAYGLGLTRSSPGRPPAPFPDADLDLFVRRRGGNDFSETHLKKVLAQAYDVSASAARTRIKAAKARYLAERDRTRAKLAMALNGGTGETNRDDIAELMAANGLASLARTRG